MRDTNTADGIVPGNPLEKVYLQDREEHGRIICRWILWKEILRMVLHQMNIL
jgi:hypothetical protein